jgi:hypothetical protein
MSDVKEDLSGISKPGNGHPKIAERINPNWDFRF